MATNYAIRPTTNKLLRALRQQEALTGTRLDPEQVRAIVEGGLSAEASVGLERARLTERKRQFDETLEFREDALAREERAAAITGGAQLGALGYETFKLAPERMKLFSERTEAIKGLGSGTSAIPTDIATTTGALPGVSATAAGETGLSLASGAIPETFLSASTGQTISTATGEAAGVGTMGTIGAGAGAFGVGGIAGENIGKGKGSIVAGVAAGAAYGSIVPGIGTVVGGVIGGVGAAVGADTVICSELNRQGYLPDRIMELGSYFRHTYIPLHEYIGYRFLADPIVERMQVSRLTTLVVKPFALSWSYTMAHKMDTAVKVNPIRKLVGNLILLLGRPCCRWRFNKAFRGGICHG